MPFFLSPTNGLPRHARLNLPDLPVSKTINHMIIHHAARLHKGITNGRADKSKAAFEQVSAHGAGLVRFRRDFLQAGPGVLLRLAAHETPYISIKRAELFLDFKKSPGISNRCL